MGQDTVHLAIVRQPYLGMILDGAKTAEARLSRSRRVPYTGLESGQTIYLKPPGGPICARATAGRVHRVELTGPADLEAFRDRFGAALGGRELGAEYWEAKADARYAVAVELEDVARDNGPDWYRPTPGRSAWRVIAPAD